MISLPLRRVRELLDQSRTARIAVVGDIMLDHFIWGRVTRISPEAPVPVVDFERESFMPGGAANVARNLTSLGAGAEMYGVVGEDDSGVRLRQLLGNDQVDCRGVIAVAARQTTNKVRIVASQQQVARLDRETREPIALSTTQRLIRELDGRLGEVDGVIVGDYGKGVVTQELLNGLKERCRARAKWLSVDPKPVHQLELRGLSLITPNRKEAFELAGLSDTSRQPDPLNDPQLLRVAEKLLEGLSPALLLITLGESGMLLCQRKMKPVHIPTVAREVFDVSGAGDTVIASFTLAIAAGASPVEAAIFSNHAAGVVVGKRGTATVSPEELWNSFNPSA